MWPPILQLRELLFNGREDLVAGEGPVVANKALHMQISTRLWPTKDPEMGICLFEGITASTCSVE